MAKQYFRKKLLRIKAELTPGVEDMAGTWLDVIAFGVEWDPIAGEMYILEEDKPGYGSDPESLVGNHSMLSCKVYCSGSGTAGTAPRQAALLKACNYVETLSVGVDARYERDDASTATVTIGFRQGLTFQKVLGCKGMVDFESKKKTNPVLSFAFKGAYQAPTAIASIPALDRTGWVKSVPFNKANVLCSIGGVVVGLHEIMVKGGQKVEFYEHSEEESTSIEDAKVRYDMLIEEPELATLDVQARIVAGTEGAFSYVHGLTAGNIFELASTRSQMSAPFKRESVQGISALRINGPLLENGANPDLEIIFR